MAFGSCLEFESAVDLVELRGPKILRMLLENPPATLGPKWMKKRGRLGRLEQRIPAVISPVLGGSSRTIERKVFWVGEEMSRENVRA